MLRCFTDMLESLCSVRARVSSVLHPNEDKFHSNQCHSGDTLFLFLFSGVL